MSALREFKRIDFYMKWTRRDFCFLVKYNKLRFWATSQRALKAVSPF